MKKNRFIISVLMIVLGFTLSSLAQENKKDTSEFPVLTGKYFGQKLPGTVPEVFAPGIVSTKDMAHSPLVISQDGNDIAWFVLDNDNTPPQDKIYYTREINGVWTEPKFIITNTSEVIYDMYFSVENNLVCMSFKYNSTNKKYLKAINTFKRTGKGWQNPTVSEYEHLDFPV